MGTNEISVNALEWIEDHIYQRITIEEIADHMFVSAVHLQRVFHQAFGLPIAEYIRERKMQIALEMLYQTDLRIVDVAYALDFSHETSFIRAFTREFGMSPGKARKAPVVHRVQLPLTQFPEKVTEKVHYAEVEVVMVPSFTIAGKAHVIQAEKDGEDAQNAVMHFAEEGVKEIQNPVTQQIYIGLTCPGKNSGEERQYMTGVLAKKDTRIPDGYEMTTVPSCLCLRYRYMGDHHYLDFDRNIAKQMQMQIEQVAQELNCCYEIPCDFYYEKIDKRKCGSDNCEMEWYTPIYPRMAG